MGPKDTCPRRKKDDKKGSTPVRGNTGKGIGESKLKTPGGQARKVAGEKKLNGQDPNTMPAKSKFKLNADSQAEEVE